MSRDEHEKIDVLIERIDNLSERLERFEMIAEKQFVTRAEFWPVRALVYGCVSIVLVAVVSAAVTLVVRVG
ncbi:MAG TPA: hypothetical protein VNQ90_15660 [Chthoniobacteraceae bacterium]|nr:hypothetical protein [Chthoniobacteraceae bacterium]